MDEYDELQPLETVKVDTNFQQDPRYRKALASRYTYTDEPSDEKTEDTQDEDQKQLSKKLELQQIEFSQKTKDSLYGQYPQPIIEPSKMLSNGLPWFFAQHPNKWSANPNEVMLYKNLVQFQTSDFFSKYKDRLIFKQAIQDFAGKDVPFTIDGKDYRIVFASLATDDKNKYYIDCKDTDDYITVLNDIKKSHILLPVELASQKFIQDNQLKAQEILQQTKELWSKGYDYSSQLYNNAIEEQQYKQHIVQAKTKDVIDQQQAMIQQQQDIIQQQAQAQQSSSDPISGIVGGIASIF